MSDDMRELEQTIRKLQDQRNQILKEKEAADFEQFKKLEWIKETSAYLRINAFLASGTNRYEITLHGPIPNFRYNTHIPIYKTLAFTNYNSSFLAGTSNRGPQLVTSSTDDLIEFLAKHRFKSFSFNEEDAKLYYFLHCMER